MASEIIMAVAPYIYPGSQEGRQSPYLYVVGRTAGAPWTTGFGNGSRILCCFTWYLFLSTTVGRAGWDGVHTRFTGYMDGDPTRVAYQNMLDSIA